MALTIDTIKENEHFEYKGDVHVTGSIGAGAKVTIKDGSLIIDGNVGERSNISLTTTQSTVVVSSMTFYSCSSSTVLMGSAGSELHIHGSVGNNAQIQTKSSEIKIDGNIGSGAILETMSGKIRATFVNDSASLKTMSGDIQVENVGSSAKLKTMSGDIRAADVGCNSSLQTMSGDVRVDRAHPSVSLKTMSGSIYENGVMRRKERHGTTTSVSIGGLPSGSISFDGMRLFGSVGRLVVDGQDVTHLLRAGTSSGSSTTPSSEPVTRYQFN